MRRVAFAAGLLLATLSAVAASTSYGVGGVGGVGVIGRVGTGGLACDVGADVGGACFSVPPGAKRMSVEIRDLGTGTPVGGQFRFWRSETSNLNGGTFCGSASDVWVHAEAWQVNVYQGTPLGECGFGPATLTEIAVHFT